VIEGRVGVLRRLAFFLQMQAALGIAPLLPEVTA